MICKICGRAIATAHQKWWYNTSNHQYYHTLCSAELPNIEKIRKREEKKIKHLPLGDFPEVRFVNERRPIEELDFLKKERKKKNESKKEWQEAQKKENGKRILAVLNRGKFMTRAQIMFSIGYTTGRMSPKLILVLKDLVSSGQVTEKKRQKKQGGSQYIANT